MKIITKGGFRYAIGDKGLYRISLDTLKGFSIQLVADKNFKNKGRIIAQDIEMYKDAVKFVSDYDRDQNTHTSPGSLRAPDSFLNTSI